MRSAFINTLHELAQSDDRIVLVTGDLGFGVVTDFMQKLPKQFLNVGVAEQNMTGIATGLALSGKIVFTYSIANFPTLRCLEQIRNDACYHEANVKIVSVGGGMSYGSLGVSHHATEDLAVMRVIPNLAVVAPNDPVEVEHAVRALVRRPGPAYLRLGRAGERRVHGADTRWALGKTIRVREGGDACLLVTGGLLHEALDGSDRLARHGLRVGVVSVHTLSPLDRDELASIARATPALFTVEEHSVAGGLGSAVAELLLEGSSRPALFRRIGLPAQKFSSQVGDQAYLRKHYRLDAEGISSQVLAAITERPKYQDVAARTGARRHLGDPFSLL